MALSPTGNRRDRITAAKETTESVAPTHFSFAQKYLDNNNNISQNTCEVTGYFRSFESYENIRNTKCPITTYPDKEITLACFACLCFIRRGA